VIKKINIYFEQIIKWLGKRSWGVITGILFFLIFLEIFELLHKEEPLFDPFHLVELIIYVLILAFMGVLINFYIMANVAKKQTLEILKRKHNLSLELAALDDWEELISKLVKLPGTVAPVGASRIHICNSVSGQMEDVARWSENGAGISNLQHDCRKCLTEREITDSLVRLHCSSYVEAVDGATAPKEYCLSITSADNLLALIQFQLKIGENLSDEQKEIFENVEPEIAWALKVAREQKMLSEMRLTEKTMAERHSLSTYLHDNLSQSLAYICLKLDQLTKENEQVFVSQLGTDLQSIKSAAQDSFNIVRRRLEIIHPETTPHFVNLIVAYAKKVSERADIEISIDKIGEDVLILPDVQQTIFYVFQEALSNVEKHARAKNVKVLINWGDDSINVTISDDGVGFDLQHVNRAKHFGMEIMQERIENVNGSINIQSSEDSGTTVSLNVPIQSPDKGKDDG
jgi:signal transduction histidine kinase